MAGFSNTWENHILSLILEATAIANFADNASVSPATAVWISLHSADPGDAGTQGTNEISYTGYARTQVNRNSTSWAVSGGTANPTANITFPQATSTTTGTITHASIGKTSASTGGDIIASGTVSPNINFGQNVTPRLTTSSTFSLD